MNGGIINFIVNLIVSPIPWLFFAGAPLVNLLGQRSALIRPILRSPDGHVQNFAYKFANFRWVAGWGGLAAETRRPFSTLLYMIYIDQQDEERFTNNEMNENIYDTISFFHYNTLSNIAINYYLIIDILDDQVYQ